MKLVYELFSNWPLVAGAAAFILSQILKVIIYALREKRFKLIHFFEAAGMPSTHSAMSCAMALMIGMLEGFHSSMFAVALIFTIIVLYDAMGVRFAAGQMALVLNKIIEDIYAEKVNEKKN